jgi:penicillin-binding protein activator
MSWSSVMMRISRPFVVLLAFALLACGGKRVTRIDPNSVTDLSGRWNDTDSRLVANELIRESLNAPWARQYAQSRGGETPVVLIGEFRNQTMDHIPVGTFVSDLERAFISTGAVRVVASKQERQEVRAERQDQQEHARADTRAKLAQELGARYILQGSIQAIEDSEGREKIVFYQVDATIVDVESNLKIWTGQHKIKKYIERTGIRM